MVSETGAGAVRSLWNEPRVPEPPATNGWDRAFVAAICALAVGEAVLRPDLEMRSIALAVGLLPIACLLWRRSHPLAAVAVAFSIHGLTYLVPTGERSHEDLTLYATAFILVLPYSLLRWASGRQAVVGLLLIFLTHLGVLFEPGGLGEAIGGLAVLELPAALGATMRYRAVSRLRTIEQVRSREREQLARELHDIVAHHVSAIAIQAQAGRAVADSDPSAALDVLQVIEAEASRTLGEMRTMVSALRGDEHAALAPQRGIEDIGFLAEQQPGGPVVEVIPSGDLGDLTPAVDAALYRLAQESITNAVKHARRATRIRVAVEGDPDAVRLTVSDDGEVAPLNGSTAGYGIVGMKERVTILGGTLAAGPGRDRGWTVTAVLPRRGAAQ
ncbi:MAG: sensor histidine kinase [Microthrixaceae bacterium]